MDQSIYPVLRELFDKKVVVANFLLKMGEKTHAINEVILVTGLAVAYYNKNQLTGAEKKELLRMVNSFCESIK